MSLKANDHILFLGDSITDCDRDRSAGDDSSLGEGYVRICHSMLHALAPAEGFRITNRGVSGDRIYDLEERLEADVIALKPDVVSILIGVNDTWQRYGRHQQSSPIPEFIASYRRVLERLVATIDPLIIICEPFILPFPEDRRQWREDLDPRIQAVRELADQFGVILVELDRIFTGAIEYRVPEFWLPDGVHPSASGHGLIASAWLRSVGFQFQPVWSYTGGCPNGLKPKRSVPHTISAR